MSSFYWLIVSLYFVEQKMFLNIKITSKRTLKYHSKSALSSVGLYILSAVRTPIGLLNGTLSEFSAQQLGSIAFKEALQRALVPSKDIHNVFLNCDLNTTNEVINRTGLSKTTKVTSVSLFGMENFIEAIKFLLMGNQVVCMAGGMDSTSNLASVVNKQNLEHIKSIQENNLSNPSALMKYAEQDYTNFLEANKNGAFFDEIIKIHFIKKGQQIVVREDEVATFHFSTGENLKNLKYSPTFGDGAAAVVISTEDFVRNNHLSPLAKIISFSEESAVGSDIASAQYRAIDKALKMASCQCSEIRRWEIDSRISVAFNFINHFTIDFSLVNKDGGAFSLGYPVGMSGMRALCHLTHSLRDGELGCAVTCDFSRSISVIIIQKLSRSSSEKPHLTLYTKHICPLCDELKEGLKAFEGRFSFKEIDIEVDENKNYNDLFKYEIPVLFLEGRFLCKNKLDAELLNRRLAAYENVF